MDKTILKKFASESRKILMDKIEQKINLLFIDEEFNCQIKDNVYILSNDNHCLFLSAEDYENRKKLIKKIKETNLYETIEEASYTWFNRLIALRYMEVNDILPLTKDNNSLSIHVLSSNDNKPDPEILKYTNLINPELDLNFDENTYNQITNDNEKFNYILILICKKIGQIIPQIFGNKTDYINILIPDNLLSSTGFITKLLTEISIDNYQQVEIIGWLYQYYNQSEKDRVIASNRPYQKNEIPYATQIFTPNWIVKYMVENSLGKFWLENTDNQDIKNNWQYYINSNINITNNYLDPTTITFIDPCCGSGHILVYAFEIFYQIYESLGYNPKEIPTLILKNNLYGLDIDERAGQLSILSIILKAREYDKNIFNNNIIKNLNIMNMETIDSQNIIDKISDLDIINLIDNFKDIKEIGSLLLIEDYNYQELINKINHLQLDDNLIDKLLRIVKQAKLLSKKYDIVVTNPPYLNNRVMSPVLKQYIIDNYQAFKTDLFAVFIKRNSLFGKKNAYLGFMTPNVWMFITSYEKLRKFIIENLNIDSLIQLAKGSFFKEATVDICTFILKNNNLKQIGKYFRLENYKGGMDIQEQKFLEIKKYRFTDYYEIDSHEFLKLPTSPIAYWVSNRIFDIFQNYKPMSYYATAKQGLATADNNKFLRYWFEIDKQDISFNTKSTLETIDNSIRWYPYNKGGDYRKWYGNNEYIVNWYNNGHDIKNNFDEKGKLRSRPQNTDYYFKSGITWTLLSSSYFGVRYSNPGFIFDVNGMTLFPNDENLKYYLLGFMASKINIAFLNIINPTMAFQIGDILKLPIIIDYTKKEQIDKLVTENLILAKDDWDISETSWDFLINPLVKYKNNQTQTLISDIYQIWEKQCHNNFLKMQENEEKLNQIFIDIYKLNNEISNKLENKDITMKKIDKITTIKELISYAVGCMFGRYSLDCQGLIFTGGDIKYDKYQSYQITNDNIILITEDDYFPDDITNKFKNFIEIVFGKNTLYSNLEFIADTLGKKGTETAIETIRRYFNTEFYIDHLKMYNNRPIYWLFKSGKKNAFQCLIYIHRYNETTITKIRLDYLSKKQTLYENILNNLCSKIANNQNIVLKQENQKKQIDITNKLKEINAYQEKISHLANQNIKIDLNDGIIKNYAKLSDVLEKIKG